MKPQQVSDNCFAVLNEKNLVTLRCRFAAPSRKLLPSRWPLRPALHKFHGA